MTTNARFGTLTIKNNGEQDVIQNCILNVGVNVIGSSVNANVRLYDTNIDEQHCIVEVKEDGLVTVAALHIFPQAKINNLALLKNRKVVLKNGDVLKISNTEITYTNDTPRTCNQAGITKKQKIFPFNTPRRRSCNVTSSSAKKAPASARLGAINKQSLFSPSPLIVKKNLPPKHNDDWPSEPLDRDQFPFVGHFSPQKKERPLQDIPEAMSGLEDITKPSSPSLVNVVAPTVRTSTCTSTSDFDKKKTDETMIPDVKSEISINSNDVSRNSFYKPSVCVSACLSGRKSSLPAQNNNPKTSKRQSRSSSCVTPTKASLPLKSRLTCSEHKLSNESQPSFLQSESIDMENSTTSPRHENSELNSSTPTSAVRSSNNLTLLSTPTSIIKKQDLMLSLNKMDKTNIMDNSEACEKSKSRLFDQSLESVDGDSLAVSTDTSSFVYESALAVLPSVDDFEVEEIVEDSQVSVAPVSKSLNSSTIAPNDSDISGIASLASTPEPKSTISNYEMMISQHVDIEESISNQTDLSYESTVSVHNDEDTLKDSQFEPVQNYSSITISSNENLDTSDADSLNSDLIDLREPSFEKLEDEMEEIRRDSKRRMSLDMEPRPEAHDSMHRLSQILNIDEQQQETPEIQNTEEEVILVNAEFQSSAVQIGTRSSARKSKMFQVTDEETNSSSMQVIEDESGNGSSLILAMDQEDETTDELSVIGKKVNETFTLTETPAKMADNSETHLKQFDEIKNCEEIDNFEIEDNDESLKIEKVEIVPERKSKRISLRQDTSVVSGNSSTRKSKICNLPKIRINDQTIEINDSEDTDASTASESKSKRKSKLLRTPVKNSPTSSEVRSTRKSKIPQTTESNDDDTPVKKLPDVFVVRSTRKSSIPTPSVQEGSDCNASVQISEDMDASVAIQTPLVQGSLIAFGDRSTKKSKVFQTPLLKEDEVFGFDDSDDTDGSVSAENTSSIDGSSVAADVRSVRKSKIVQTPLLQDDNSVEIQDVLVATDRKSKRISKVLQNSLIPDSPLTSEVGFELQNEEDFESNDSEDIDRSVFTENKTPSVQHTPVVGEGRSTRKSKIVQTPSLQVDEIVASEDVSASGRKSRRISNILKTPSVSGTPITSGVVSTRKSKIFQTTLLEDEEASKSEDAEEMDDSILTENKSKLQTPSMQPSPAVAEVRSTRKSKIVQTPSLPDNNIVEPEDTLASTDRKSKRISKAPPNFSILDWSDTSEIDSTTKSEVPETFILQDQDVFSDSEDMDDLVSTDNNTRCASTMQCTPASQVESTRKSKIDQTPSLQGDEIVESEDISASGRKSRRISNVVKMSSVSDTPVSSGIGSTRKSNVLQTSLLEKEEISKSGESEDVDDSLLIQNKSRRTSALLQTPSMPSPAVTNVRSTRKSKIVETPTLPDDKIVEPEDTLAATDRKSKRISKVLLTSSILDLPVDSVDSTIKSQVPEISEGSDSSNSENMDDSVSTENTKLQASSIQGTPTAVELRSARKSKIVQTPSLQDDEIVESAGISASGRKSRRISNVIKTPSISGTPITSGVGSTRKSKVIQTPLLENIEVSQSGDLEDADGSILVENESRRTSTILQTPSMQRSPAVAEVRSTRKSKIVESQDTLAGTERKSKRISKALQISSISDSLETSEVESQVLETSVLQDEAFDSSGSEGMDDSVFSDNNSIRESTLPQAQPVQCTPTAGGKTTSLQDYEIVESGGISASGRKSRRISNILKTPSVSGTPITSGVVSARKSKIFQTPLLEDEETSKSGEAEEMDDSILTKNKSRRTSTLLQTPSMQPSPAVAKVRSTRKSKIVPTPPLQDDIEGNTDEKADQLEDNSPTAANTSRTSKLPSTPLVQSSPASSGIRSARKSKIPNTPLQNEEVGSNGSTNAIVSDVLDATENESSTFQVGSPRRSQTLPTHSLAESADSGVTAIETDRKSKRISKIPSLQNTPTASGVIPTRKSKILQTPLSENEDTETETTTIFQTPSTHDLPTTSEVRSTRKSKVSKTPLLLNNEINVETEEMDTPINKSKLLSTPQSSPVVSGVRSTRKSKISATPIVISAMQTRRGSKAPQTPMIQEEASTSTMSASKSKRTSKLLQTNSDSTPGTSGIQVKRTSQVLKTPSMQDFNQTNSGIKSKRISKLQQTPLIQEEANLSNVSGRKSATPKNIEKSKTDSSAIKPQRISKAFETVIDFEEIESPRTSPVKSRNTSKVLTFNTPTDKDDSESEVETSPAPKRRKTGGRTANTDPHNDLTNVQGVKTLFKTPKVQKQPHNDLTDVRGVKTILKTPKAVKEPKNDLTNVKGVKKLMATPKVQNSPANDLTNVGGVKKLLKTPRAPKEPRNDLTDIEGVKKLLTTPTKQKSPQNDLSDVRGVKQLVVTPKPRKSANLSGLGDLFATTSKTTTPKHGLSEVRGVKKILDIKSKKSSKVQKSPKNDLTNVVGVKKMFAEEEAQYNRDFNVSGVAEIMNKSDELFNSLLDKKPPKTYGRKSTPLKLDASVNVGVVSESSIMSEEVVNWVNTQDFNKGEVVDNLTPIKSKNNENLKISKKQDVAIHSSTPLNKGNRGILKEIEANIHQDIESSDAINDKNLKKVQFLDDSNLRKSKRTPRTPSKIATGFVMTSSKSRKRKADQDENLSSAKVPKMVSESNKVILIDSETDSEDAVTRKVLPKKSAKKVPKSQSKKTTHVNSNNDKVEEESVDNNEEDAKVEAPKTTRVRTTRKANKKSVEVKNNEEINASNEEKIESEKIEALKTTRSRPGKKTNAKMTKKMEKLQIENTEEIETNEKVEENFDQNEEIEAPKTTRGRNLRKTAVKTSRNENSIEEIEAPKTRRGRPLQKTNTKTSTQMEKVEGDKNSDTEEVEENEEVETPQTIRGRPAKKTKTKASKKVEKVENSTNDDEEIEMPETTRGRAIKKTSAKNPKTSLTEEKNESLRKTTRSRKVEKKSEPKKQLDSSVEILSDEENDEPVIAVPKKTRGRPASKIIKEVPENNVDEEIEAVKTTRGRAVKNTSAKTSKKSVEENQKANLTEEKNESLKKATRSRKVAKKPEPAKQFDSSVEILSDEENDEPAIEVQKTTRGRAASKTNEKVPEKSSRLRAAPKGKKVTEVEISINSTMESSKARIEETSVTLSKTKRTRGIKRSLEVESTEEQENSITANQKKNSKRSKVENDSQLEKELEVLKTSRRRPVVKKTSESRVRVLRANKNSIENSEMEESKNEETNKAVRGRKTKAGVQSESKTEEEESKGAKTRGKRKLYSLDDSVKIDVEEVVVEVKKVSTRNKKEKAEVVAPVRSSKRTRK